MKQFIIFGSASVLGALIDFTIVALLVTAGYAGVVAFAAAMAVSATVVYLIHEYITFQKNREAGFKSSRFIAFLANTSVIYLWRVAIFYLLVRLSVPELIAVGVSLVSSLFINFIISRTLIFKS